MDVDNDTFFIAFNPVVWLITQIKVKNRTFHITAIFAEAKMDRKKKSTWQLQSYLYMIRFGEQLKRRINSHNIKGKITCREPPQLP